MADFLTDAFLATALCTLATGAFLATTFLTAYLTILFYNVMHIIISLIYNSKFDLIKILNFDWLIFLNLDKIKIICKYLFI